MATLVNNNSEKDTNELNRLISAPLENGGISTPIFITGIGTGVGKTLASAIIVEALQADYWKPIQAGFDDGTDNSSVKTLISNARSVIYDEAYRLKLAASPHIAAREEGIGISIDSIIRHYHSIPSKKLVIEGAGGLMVPINGQEFVIDIAEQLNAKIILVSRNYLGSINHSLMTAALCKQRKLDVIGWIFNDQYLQYEEEICGWSGYPKIASIPFSKNVNSTFVIEQAGLMRGSLVKYLSISTNV